MSRQSKYLLIVLILIGFAFRLPGLFGKVFHPDEALFSSLALDIHNGHDRFLLDQRIDKPPLLFFTQAFFYSLLSPSLWSAKLPGMISSIVAIPLVASFCWRVYREEFVSLLSAALLSLSPLAIEFGPRAFIDPFLTLFLLGSLFLVSETLRNANERVHPRLTMLVMASGLLFGLATATKHQAWLFLPLIVSWAVISGWGRRKWARFLIGAVPIWLVLTLWDLLGNGRIDLWQAQLSSYGGIRVAWSWELWSRLDLWSDVWGRTLNSPLLSFAILLAIPPFVALLIQDLDRNTAVDQSLLLFVLGYFLLHWFVAVPVWERYLFPVLPVAFILIARYFRRVLGFAWDVLWPGPGLNPIARRFDRLWAMVFVAILLPATLFSSKGGSGFDGESWTNSNMQAITVALSEAPYGTVLYDHWYSWLWRYYLYDSRVYVSWFPHPGGLAADLAVFGREPNPRYVVLPGGSEAKPVIRTVRDAGFRLIPVELESGGESVIGPRLYKIEPI